MWYVVYVITGRILPPKNAARGVPSERGAYRQSGLSRALVADHQKMKSALIRFYSISALVVYGAKQALARSTLYLRVSYMITRNPAYSEVEGS